MAKIILGGEALETFFYDRITNLQAAAPSDLSPEAVDFVRLTVESEQTAPIRAAAPDFKRTWQQALSQAEEIKASAGQADLAEKDNILPLPITASLTPHRRPNWPLTLVASLVVAVVTGLVVLLVVVQTGLTAPNVTSVANSPAAAPKTPTPTPKPSFNGLELPYPGAASLTVPPDLWYSNYPANVEVNPTQTAFSTSDKADKILSYYRQKLAGYTDYIESRPSNPSQVYEGLVAFKGSSMLVINVLEASKRESFNNASSYFKLFRQMPPDQTLLTISYGPVPDLPAMPDLSLPGSTNLTNYDPKTWPDLFEPFGTYDNHVMIRVTQTVFSTTSSYVRVVNTVKLRLIEGGYEIFYETYNSGSENCQGDCLKNGWDIMIASKGARTILVRIYGPTGRDAFQPAEIQKLTAQGLKPDQTLVSYRTGLSEDYNTSPRPVPYMKTATLSWAPDASYLALTRGNEVQLWKNGVNLSLILDSFQAPAYKLSWSPDSQTLAIASGFGIQFWSAQTQKLTPFAASHTASIKTLAWSPDGKTLASAAGCLTDASNTCDERVLLWQPNGSLVAILPGHAGSPNALLWSPDGQQLATEQNDAEPGNVGTVRLWNAQGKQLLTLDAHPFSADNMAWLPAHDSRVLVTGPVGPQNQGLKFWDTTSGHLIKNLPTAVGTLGMSRLAWSPDGTMLAMTENNAVKLWRYSDGQLIKTLTGHSDLVTALDWSPDGKFLATAGQDATIRIWDKQGNPITVQSGPVTPFYGVSWSPDSSVLYGLTSDNNLWFWDGSQMKGGISGIVQGRVAWVPGSDRFASYDSSGMLTFWNNALQATSTFMP